MRHTLARVDQRPLEFEGTRLAEASRVWTLPKGEVISAIRVAIYSTVMDTHVVELVKVRHSDDGKHAVPLASVVNTLEDVDALLAIHTATLSGKAAEVLTEIRTQVLNQAKRPTQTMV